MRFFEICVFFLRFSEVFKVLALKNKKDTFLKNIFSQVAAKLPRSTELLTKKENKYNNNIIHNTGICVFVISCVLINIMFHMCFPLYFEPV